MEALPEALEGRIARIADVEDERVADYRDLKEADLAGNRGAFIAESEVVLRVLAARGRFPIRSVFVAESRVDKVADVLAGLDAAVPIYVASQAVLSGVVGFRFHRGIVASGQRLPAPSVDHLLSELLSGFDGPRRVLLLEGLTNHDNVGGIFRNAAAFGADAVLLDETSCDPLYRKAIRVSVGGSLIVPYTRMPTIAAALAELRAHGFSLLALSPKGEAVPMAEIFAAGAPERVALLLGTEGPGLSASTLSQADVMARIEMASGFDSLNVATASGIALHAVAIRQGDLAG